MLLILGIEAKSNMLHFSRFPELCNFRLALRA